MSDRVHGLVEAVAVGMELAGVAVIVVGAVIAALISLSRVRGRPGGKGGYRDFRANLGRAILLGLELLVAGDIIATILVDASLESVVALGLIVLIRTFLSFSLETEIEGTLPWRRAAEARTRG